jgi:type IV pilus assembly protein PilB
VIDFRVSTLPTLFGEKIVIRILDPSSAKLGIDALGYEPEEKSAC